MPDGEPTTEELLRSRETVKSRLSRRNWFALIVMLLAIPLPIISALRDNPFQKWTIVVALFAPGVAMGLWDFNPWHRSRVRCPACGENWEHDEFLGWSQCAKCGLPLPADPED